VDEDGHEIFVDGDDKFVAQVVASLKKIINTKTYAPIEAKKQKGSNLRKIGFGCIPGCADYKGIPGYKLICDLVNNTNKATISRSNSANSEYQWNSTTQNNKTSVSGTIQWQPSSSLQFWKGKEHISLAHELIHIQHAFAGNITNTPVGLYLGPVSNQWWLTKYQTDSSKWISSEELRTVGIRFTMPGDITENSVRSSLGLSLRDVYQPSWGIDAYVQQNKLYNPTSQDQKKYNWK
jgi:hypothetical protein